MRRWWCRLRGHPLRTREFVPERTDGRLTAATYFKTCRCGDRREFLERRVLQFPRRRG